VIFSNGKNIFTGVIGGGEVSIEMAEIAEEGAKS